MSDYQQQVPASLSCFMAYDVRGRVPDELNEAVAWRIGRAYAAIIAPRKVVVGHDIRLSSPALLNALADGLMDGGVDVYDIGLCGTEEIYFATSHEEMDGGIMVTASHNPIDYNGLKFVREGSRPISGDSGLGDIRAMAEGGVFPEAARRGERQPLDVTAAYRDHLLSYVDSSALKPLKIVVNPGNGGAGKVIKLLEDRLPFEFIKLNFDPDGSFPNGIPNPLLPENRQGSVDAVRQHQANIGIAWDGDFDRCFFFDENGRFIEGYYIVGLLAEALLAHNPGAGIIHDPRLTWNTIDVVKRAGGEPIQSKTGHAFIKERMRAEDAVYGGEMSAHHYFREFAYCDSGMIPWLLVAELMSRSGSRLSELVDERMAAFPASGEINRRLADPHAAVQRVRDAYVNEAKEVDLTDGLSLDMGEWRFNLRPSNTEPVLRLNVESRGDETLMRRRTQAILAIIDATSS